MKSTLLALVLLAGCSDTEAPSVIAFELDAPLAGDTFWDLPFPSDLRLVDGRPDLAGFPNPRNLPVVEALLSTAKERRGYPVMPIAWFRFREEVAIDANAATLVDIDDASPDRGTEYPVLVQRLADDAFGKGLVAIAPVPGIVLRANTRHAFVLAKGFASVDAPAQFAKLRGGRGAAADLYAPLWPVLDELGIEPLVATVFTTGDEVALLRARSEAVTETAQLGAITLAQTHADYCELRGTVTLPQYQRGTQPFDQDGLFMFDGERPVAQATMTVPLVLTIPRGAMPANGWPLWQFFHGSGGASFDLVDDGPVLVAGGEPLAGEGTGAVVARRGIAAVAAAMPLNPERLPGASNYAYLNLNNLRAFPFTFQQGVFEQRMLLDVLLAAELPGCDSPKTRFDATKLTAGGHSMGGMYTNMITAIEPRYGAITPFGAGGFWNMMILDTAIIPGSRDLLGGVLGVDSETLTFVHPALGLIGLGWEIAEPGASMSRIAHRPLAGMPPRHVYQPIGKDDQFFANPVFDAAALAYGNEQAGELVWQGTQDALRVGALDGMKQYPVKANRGTTAVVVQYTDGGILDAHYIYRQREEVRYQYGCFLATFLRDGVPTVAAPAPVGSACPL
jgi:hypothetical protein